MRNLLNKIFLFPFFLALYFPLSIISQNLKEIDLRTIPRIPLIVILAVLIFMLFFRFLLKSWQKSALVTALLFFCLFLYGLLYGVFKLPAIFNGFLGRHRILSPAMLILMVGIVWAIARYKGNFDNLVLILNLLGIFLFFMTLINFGIFIFNKESNQPFIERQVNTLPAPQVANQKKPDIYFIVLDAYDRQDYLLKNFNFDNSGFIASLRELGFYVADCSRPNYAHTILSISSTLNLDYLQNFNPQDLNDYGLKDKLIHSRVRDELEKLGYQTVSFANVHWDFSDADVFIDFPNPLFSTFLQPIESLIIDNSFLRAIIDLSPDIRSYFSNFLKSPIKNHYQQQLAIINKLPELAQIHSPKFVFAHIEKPHGPFVFDANGELLQEDAYYRDTYFSAINREYFEAGYSKQIGFLNQQMLANIATILKNSKIPPIIVVEGDHGIGEEQDLGSRLNNLYAIHLPDQNYTKLYEGFSPVNTFRLIFSQYFKLSFDLLPDSTYYSPKEFRLDFTQQPEESLVCMK